MGRKWFLKDGYGVDASPELAGEAVALLRRVIDNISSHDVRGGVVVVQIGLSADMLEALDVWCDEIEAPRAA